MFNAFLNEVCCWCIVIVVISWLSWSNKVLNAVKGEKLLSIDSLRFSIYTKGYEHKNGLLIEVNNTFDTAPFSRPWASQQHAAASCRTPSHPSTYTPCARSAIEQVTWKQSRSSFHFSISGKEHVHRMFDWIFPAHAVFLVTWTIAKLLLGTE